MAKQPASDCRVVAKEQDSTLNADTEGTARAEGVGELSESKAETQSRRHMCSWAQT